MSIRLQFDCLRIVNQNSSQPWFSLFLAVCFFTFSRQLQADNQTQILKTQLRNAQDDNVKKDQEIVRVKELVKEKTRQCHKYEQLYHDIFQQKQLQQGRGEGESSMMTLTYSSPPHCASTVPSPSFGSSSHSSSITIGDGGYVPSQQQQHYSRSPIFERPHHDVSHSSSHYPPQQPPYQQPPLHSYGEHTVKHQQPQQHFQEQRPSPTPQYQHSPAYQQQRSHSSSSHQHQQQYRQPTSSARNSPGERDGGQYPPSRQFSPVLAPQQHHVRSNSVNEGHQQYQPQHHQSPQQQQQRMSLPRAPRASTPGTRTPTRPSSLKS